MPDMSAINWSVDELVEISGVPYRIRSRARTGEINLEHVRDSRFVTMTDGHLATLWSNGELQRITTAEERRPANETKHLKEPLRYLSDATRKQIERRYPYMRAFAELKVKRNSGSYLEPLILKVANDTGDLDPPSVPLLQRWIREWRSLGSPDVRDMRCLAPLFHLRGNSEKRFDPDVKRIFDETIQRLWLKPTKESVENIHLEASRRVAELDITNRNKCFLAKDGGLLLPSLRTVYRMVNNLDKELVIRSQQGSIAAKRQCEPVLRAPEAEYPLQVVEIDHTQLDIVVLDKERKAPLGRPWITTAIDRFSRMPVGVYISFLPPGAYNVMQCLKNLIQTKDWLKHEYPEVIKEWPCFGRPETIVVDNGRDYHSRALREACQALGIDIQYCPVYMPNFKAKIERWFGTIATCLIHTLPGTTMSNHKKRGVYKSAEEAVANLEDLRAIIFKWIVDDYSQDVHEEIECPPIVKWNEGVKSHPVDIPARVDQLDSLLNLVVDRRLTRRGIEFEKIVYSTKHPAFRKLVNRPDLPEVLKVRINPNDLSYVIVEDWVSGDLITVPSTRSDYTDGLSLGEHRMLRKKVRERLSEHKRDSVDHLIEVRQSLRNKVSTLENNKKLKNRKKEAVREENERLGLAANDDGSAKTSANPRLSKTVTQRREVTSKVRRRSQEGGQLEREQTAVQEMDATRKVFAERVAGVGLEAEIMD